MSVSAPPRRERWRSPSSTRPLTNALISKVLWAGGAVCSGSCGRKEAPRRRRRRRLARSRCPLSPPLRTDRSFDSGSKFTLQTCWEAAELRREGLFALQGPRASAGSPVRNTEAGNKLDFGAAVRGAAWPRAPGPRRGLQEPQLREGGGRSRFYRERLFKQLKFISPSHLFTNIEAFLS